MQQYSSSSRRSTGRCEMRYVVAVGQRPFGAIYPKTQELVLVLHNRGVRYLEGRQNMKLEISYFIREIISHR